MPPPFALAQRSPSCAEDLVVAPAQPASSGGRGRPGRAAGARPTAAAHRDDEALDAVRPAQVVGTGIGDPCETPAERVGAESLRHSEHRQQCEQLLEIDCLCAAPLDPQRFTGFDMQPANRWTPLLSAASARIAADRIVARRPNQSDHPHSRIDRGDLVAVTRRLDLVYVDRPTGRSGLFGQS